MPTGQLSPLIQLMRRSAPAREQNDAELLVRFARQGDEGAFGALLERHGRMVLGLCRRVLGDAHEAEDAFQATFLLLVRKAGSLTRPGALGPWLHGVAYRTALKARAGAARRRAREVQEHDRTTADGVEELAWRDLRPLLDEAIHGLPQKYRTPFVLCYLEGKTNAQAAEEIGCPCGTIATRLSRARDRLRRHLGRRGLSLSAPLLTALLAREAVAHVAVPAPLSRSTVQSVQTLAAGGTVHLPAGALALTKGVALVMFMERMKLVLAALLVAAAAGATITSSLLAGRAIAEPPSVKSVPAAVPPPAEEDEPSGKSATHRTINFVVEAPTGRVARLIGEAAERHRKRLARLWLGKELPPWKEPCPIKVKLTASGLGGATMFAFRPDGTVQQQDMHLEGSLDGILVNSLPHEITHTVLAHHFGRPVPRWADEGAALMTEENRERNRYDRLLQEIFRKGRSIALRRLLPMADFPSDVMALYAEGYSLTRFLVDAGGRAKFLAFVRKGMEEGWDEAVRAHYHYDSVDKLELDWMRKVGLRSLPPERLGGSPKRPPDGQPLGMPPVIGIARQQGEQIVLRNPDVTTYEPREEKIGNRSRTYYVPVTRSRDILYSLKDVRIFGTDGKRVSSKEVARLLAKDRTVIVSLDGRPVDPLYLKVVKEGTLILVLQQAQPVQAPPAIATTPGVSAPNYYEPRTLPPPAYLVPTTGSPDQGRPVPSTATTPPARTGGSPRR